VGSKKKQQVQAIPNSPFDSGVILKLTIVCFATFLAAKRGPVE
jgi:hypothetical protein